MIKNEIKDNAICIVALCVLGGCGGSGGDISSPSTVMNNGTGGEDISSPNTVINNETGEVDPSKFLFLPDETYGGLMDNFLGDVVDKTPTHTSGTTHGLSEWMDRNLLCNSRNHVTQLDAGLPTLVRFGSDGTYSERRGRLLAECDSDAISNPNLCWNDEEAWDEENRGWSIFEMTNNNGGSIQVIYVTLAVNDRTFYQQGMVEYEGKLARLEDRGNNLCVPLEQGTTSLI